MGYKIKRYGWKRDLPDYRDHLYTAPRQTLLSLPQSYDLRTKFTFPIYDQGALGSCTANGIGAIFQFERIQQGLTPDFMPSRLFIYYNERVIEGTVDSDDGAMIRDGMKTIATQGSCPETEWPYDVSQFAVKPPQQCYNDGLQYRVMRYQSVLQTLPQMKGCLASGHPFVFGFTVYDSFETNDVAQTGNVPMPSWSDSAVGGHCVIAVGYDDSKQAFIIRNSWGSSWGDQGYCYMPYAYLTDKGLANDFWTIRLISHVTEE